MDLKRQVMLAAVAVVMVTTLVIYTRSANENDRNEEARWFVENLQYDFCGRVLKTEPLPQQWGYGYMICELGRPYELNTSVEDSLSSFIRHHDELEFIVEEAGRKLGFLVQGAQRLSDTDSVCVRSRDNSIMIYKNGKVISSQDMTLCLKSEIFPGLPGRLRDK